MTGGNEDRVYITYLDIIYSKDNNIRRQACWVATEKPFSFLIGKVLTMSALFMMLLIVAYLGSTLLLYNNQFPFLIGKVLTSLYLKRREMCYESFHSL